LEAATWQTTQRARLDQDADANVPKQPVIMFPDDQMISSVPDVENQRWSLDDKFVVIASDGIWAVIDSGAVASKIMKFLKDKSDLKYTCEQVSMYAICLVLLIIILLYLLLMDHILLIFV